MFNFPVLIFSCLFDVIKIKYHNVTRLCHTRNIISVNGQFPGPRLVAREGDRVLVKVINHVSNNVTIHWYESIVKMQVNFSVYIYDCIFCAQVLRVCMFCVKMQAWD